jgi:hypothetical protein
VFGPIPRDYRADLNRKVRQLARRSALNARAREGMLHVVDPFTLHAPKTSALMGLLGKLDLGARRTLILTNGSNPAVYLSGRNVQRVDVLPFSDATAYDILRADALVIESAALGAEAPQSAHTAHPKPRVHRKKAAKTAAKKAAKKAAGSSDKVSKKTAKKAKKTARKAAGTTAKKATKKSAKKAAKPHKKASK